MKVRILLTAILTAALVGPIGSEAIVTRFQSPPDSPVETPTQAPTSTAASTATAEPTDAPAATATGTPRPTPTSSGEWYDVCPPDQVCPPVVVQPTYTPNPTPTCLPTSTCPPDGGTPYPTHTPYPPQPTFGPQPTQTPVPENAYYVHPDGDDGNPGTEAQPWRTVQKAIDSATAGAVVVFADGVYDIGAGVTFNANSGTAGEPILFTAADERQATWRASARGYSVSLFSVAYITLRGIVVDCQQSVNQASRCVTLADVDHVRLEGVEVLDTDGHAVALWGGCRDVALVGCEIHPENTISDLDAIHIREANNAGILIDGCTVYHSAHAGIDVNAGVDITIQNSHVYDNQGHCISVGGIEGTSLPLDNVVIRGNVLHGAGMWPVMDGTTHNGVRIHQGAQAVDVYRNVAYRNEGKGVKVNAHVGATGPIDIYHNTFYANNQSQAAGECDVYFYREAGGTNPSIAFTNNLVYNTGTEAIFCASSGLTDVTMDYNIWYAERQAGEGMRRGGVRYAGFAEYQAAGYESHSLAVNPLLANPAGDDFAPSSNSAAIDRGADVGLPFCGERPDIGAVEWCP